MPVYQATRHLPRTLPPLVDLVRLGEVSELIVVDDASSDGTAQLARSLGARVLSMPRNSGPAAARNRGCQEALGDIFWFVDSDVQVGTGGPALIRAAFRDPAVGAVFGSYDAAPDDPYWFSRYKNLAHRYYHQRAAPNVRTFWTGCGAVRKDVFREVGGFDAVRFTRAMIEDIELGYRISASGRQIRILKDLVGKHLKAWRFLGSLRTEIFDRALPWSRLIIRREGLDDNLNVARSERVRAALAGLLLLTLLVLPFYPRTWPACLAALALVLVANGGLFRYLLRHGGPAVAAGGVAYHQFYYIYATLAFFWCLAEVKLSPTSPAGVELPETTGKAPGDRE